MLGQIEPHKNGFHPRIGKPNNDSTRKALIIKFQQSKEQALKARMRREGWPVPTQAEIDRERHFDNFFAAYSDPNRGLSLR